MKKSIPVAIWLLMCLFMPQTAMAGDSFTVGPPSLDISLPQDGSATASVYITSNFTGELVTGTQGLPVTVEPKKIAINATDANQEVPLTITGNKSPEKKLYSGEITFLVYSGDNIAYGIKVKTNVNVIDSIKAQNMLSNKFMFLSIILLVLIAALLAGFFIRRRAKRQVT